MQLKLFENENEYIFDNTWDYSGSKINTKYNNHGIHEYPAMMIPQVANRLLKEYSSDDDVLLDPFCGSGTSLLESKINFNIKAAYGIDINPLARIISKVKTTPIKPILLKKEYDELLKRAHTFKKEELVTPNVFNIEFWFKKNVIFDLTRIINSIDQIRDKNIQNFFKVVFSGIIRSVSNTRNSEFKLYKMAEKSLEKFNPDVFYSFEKQFNQNYEKMIEFYEKVNRCNIVVLNEDSRKKTTIPNKSVDILVTSPPYGDSKTTVAYGQFSRLSLQWLGFNRQESNIDNISLGGKAVKNINPKILETYTLNHIFNKIKKLDEKRSRDVLSFYIDFYKCITEFDRVMKQGAMLCFVVGNRTVKGVQIPTDKIIVELFKLKNPKYKHIKTIIRNIPNKKMPKMNSPTNIKGIKSSTMNHEYIIILKKEHL